MRKTVILAIICALVLSGCSEPNINMDETIGQELRENEIVLYFANSQATFVVPENRIVQVEKDVTKEEYASIIIGELIKGPKGENLYPTIPSEVKI